MKNNYGTRHTKKTRQRYIYTKKFKLTPRLVELIADKVFNKIYETNEDPDDNFEAHIRFTLYDTIDGKLVLETIVQGHSIDDNKFFGPGLARVIEIPPNTKIPEEKFINDVATKALWLDRKGEYFDEWYMWFTRNFFMMWTTAYKAHKRHVINNKT